jgi:spermidine/putrescine transport system permease protein
LPATDHMHTETSRAGYALSAPLAGVVIFLVVAPLFVFLLYSFLTPVPFDVEYTLTLENYRRVVGEPLWLRLLAASMQVGATTAVATIVLGYIVAYYVAFGEGRLPKVALGLTLVSILGGYLVRVYAWRTLLGREGVVNTALQRVGAIDEPLTWLLFNRGAVAIALTNVFLPFAALVVYARLANLDRDQISAARDLGAAPWQAFWLVTLPQTGRALLAGFVFVFLLASADYITPQLVGGARGTMIGVAVQAQFQSVGNWPAGAALGFSIVLGTALCIALAWGILKAAGLLPKEAGDA